MAVAPVQRPRPGCSAPPPGPPRATGRSPGRPPGRGANRCGCSRPPAGSSRSPPRPPARSSRRPRPPGRTSRRRLPGRRPRALGARSRRGRRGKWRSIWTATGSGRSTAGFAGPAGWLRCAVRAGVRRSRAARRPAAGCRCRRRSVRCPAACPGGAVGGLALAEQQVVWFALDCLAVLEAEGLRARAPPAARRLCPALAGLDVIPGRVLARAVVDLAPDVVHVIALGQGRDNRQAGLYRRGPEAAELTTIVR